MKPKSKPDPKPAAHAERIKIDGPWEDAVAKALKAPKPAGGWSKPTKTSNRQRKSA